MTKPVFDLKEITSILGKVEYGTGYTGDIATLVSYARPVPIKYHAINLHLFEGCDAKIKKSGEKWCVQFHECDEYEVSMTASKIAVVSHFWSDTKMGHSETRRIQDDGDNYLMRPITADIDLLPGQTLRRDWKGECPNVSNNSYWTKTLEETAMNHKRLSEQLFSLDEYGPKLEGIIPIPIELLIDNKIPKPK